MLYERQPYPDNYIDNVKFLDQLHTVTDPVAVSYVSTLIDCSVLAQQFAVISLFLSVYRYILASKISVPKLIFVDCVLLCVMLIANFWLDDGMARRKKSFVRSIQSLFIFGICLRISAPILQTLTLTFSEDTIYALGFILSSIHLVFFDYSLDGSNARGTISLNAAIFTAILLSSRLTEIDMVVAFMLLAVNFFSHFPETSKKIRQHSKIFHMLLTFLLWGTASYLIYYLDKTLFAVFEGMITFLWLVCPVWLCHMSTHSKKSLHGPWDEATVDVS